MSTWPPTSIPPLALDQVHVWRLSLEADASTLATYWKLLSPDEQCRAQRFALPELTRRFVVARANLRQLLGKYSGRAPMDLRFTYGPAGKPELSGGGWHFNVSHSGEQALIAVTTGAPVGIDLEMIRPIDYEGVARGVLTEAELLLLSNALPSAKADTFYRLWVRHEASVKAIGARIASHANLPTYDLEAGSHYRSALATATKDVRIEMFK